MWGPHGAKWRHVEKATSSGSWRRGRSLGGSPRLVGLTRRIRRPPPESTADRVIRAFFLAVVLVLFAPMIVVAFGAVLGYAFERYSSVVVGLCLAFWLYATWSRRASWRERILLSLGATALAAFVLVLIQA